MAGFVRCIDGIRIHEMPYGTQILPDRQGVLFRLWAPAAKTVDLMICNQAYAMQETGHGWYALVIPDAGHGTLYQFRIDGDLQVPDPSSRFQPHDVHGPSMVIDPARHEWRDSGWKGRPWHETVLYELHVGTFTPQGTFQGVKDKLDYLADLGITALELMPVSDFPGARNWGYDGVLPFAPDSRYGTPEDLKDLIQTAHSKGLMVFLDVVYNHFGPEGNYLHAYADSFFTRHYDTPWGEAINFEGSGSNAYNGRYVRDFFIQNALYWLKEYHFDGLRFDAVQAIYDQSRVHFLNELAQTVRSNLDNDRHIHLVLENDDNGARFLADGPHRLYTAQWNDDYHHAMHVLLSGDAAGYYGDYVEKTSGKPTLAHLGRCLTEGFAYQGEASFYREGKPRGEKSAHLHPLAFVNFLQNHDQIGNRAFGERLIGLTSPQAMRAALAVLLLAPSVPLLFMGQEWETRKPFLFFCDFEDGLASLVSEGRRQEFARFPAFADPAARASIPDPCAPGTFEASRLDWNELTQPEHAAWLSFYRSLLSLRQREMLPLFERLTVHAPGEVRYQVIGPNALMVRWVLDDGRRLILAANLGPDALTFNPADHHNLKLVHSRLLYQSEDQALTRLQAGNMPAWAVVWCTQEIESGS